MSRNVVAKFKIRFWLLVWMRRTNVRNRCNGNQNQTSTEKLNFSAMYSNDGQALAGMAVIDMYSKANRPIDRSNRLEAWERGFVFRNRKNEITKMIRKSGQPENHQHQVSDSCSQQKNLIGDQLPNIEVVPKLIDKSWWTHTRSHNGHLIEGKKAKIIDPNPKYSQMSLSLSPGWVVRILVQKWLRWRHFVCKRLKSLTKQKK